MLRRSVWGIDIGGHAVKGVRLRRVKDGLEVTAADVVPLRGEPSNETSFGRDRRIWIALDELVRRNHIGAERLVFSVPARATFVRPFDILVVSGRPPEEIVRLEVERLIPFGLDAVVWDHEMFGAPSEDNRQKGVMMAVKKEVLNNYLMSLSAARLQADDVLSAPLALYNYARYELEILGPTLLVNAGATCTDLVLVREEGYVLGTVPLGGDLLTRAIQERFHLTPERAEEAKRNVGRLRQARNVLEALLPALRRYGGEVQNAVRRLRAEAEAAVPTRVILTGGTAATVGLNKVLSQALETSVETPETFRRLRFAPEVERERIEPLTPQLAVAAGLALRAAGESATRISLITAGATRLKQASRKKPFVSATLAVIAVLMTWITVFGQHKAREMAAARIQIQEEVRQIENHIQRWQNLRAPSAAQKTLEQYAQLGADRFAWLRVLDKVVSILPTANRSGRNDRLKAWLLDLEIKRQGSKMEVALWWGVRARGNPSADEAFAEKAVRAPLAKVAGFTEVRMTDPSGRKGQWYANALSLDAPAVPNGRYRIFPVTFLADPSELK